MRTFNCHSKQVLHFTEAGETFFKKIFIEYRFVEATSLQAQASRIWRQFIYSVKQLLDQKPIIGRNVKYLKTNLVRIFCCQAR